MQRTGQGGRGKERGGHDQHLGGSGAGGVGRGGGKR